MTIEELARTFRGRREGKGYRAKCPVHKSRGLTLGLYPKRDYTQIVCYAGCDSHDILAAVGLKVRDVYYRQRDFSSEALKAHLAKQHIEKCYEAEKRRQALSLWQESLCQEKPVRTQSRFERDIERFTFSVR